ncbi:MAG: hypothetical protein WCH34_17935 [Bacteroidota bacterium]
MKEIDELEPQQYKRLYWEEDVPVKDVRKNVLRKFLYIGSLLGILFIVAGLLIKFPDQIELPFIIKSDKSEEIYRFSNPVYVIERYVKPGDVIKKGQALLRITSPEIVLLINNYVEAKQNLENFKNQKTFSIKKQNEILLLKIKNNRNNILETEKEYTLLENKWKSNKQRLEYENEVALKKYAANKNFFDEGHLSKFDLFEVEIRKVITSDSLESATQDFEKSKLSLKYLQSQYLSEINMLNYELQKSDIDLKYDSIAILNKFELVKNKISNTYGDFEIVNGEIIIKANSNGVISYIFEGEKEVGAGAILMKLIYNNSAMYAWIQSPASLIGRIAKDEKVVLKVASFPFYEWGTIKGHVFNQSLTPDEKGCFSVKIAIDDAGKLKTLIQAGMNGDATIILEEKTFYDYFFRKIKKTFYKATME